MMIFSHLAPCTWLDDWSG